MPALEFSTSRGVLQLDLAGVRGDGDAPPTLLDAVRTAGLPLGQSCRGVGVCRSCTIHIERGADALPPLTPLEARFGFAPDRRLACQIELSPALVLLRVHHPAWGRPPSAPTPGPDGTLQP